MRKKITQRLLLVTPIVLGVALTLYFTNTQSKESLKPGPAVKVRSSNSPKAAPRAAADRDEFFFNALRDPALNQIPANARAKELELFQSIKNTRLKSSKASTYTWAEAGPNDVGGRTRALALDVRNSDIVLAGGVSGGVWKSTDKGASWTLTNTPEETFSVTSICQDTRAGYEDTWYYASGEFDSNSAGETGASYYGHGLFKSTDNGDTWTMIYGQGSDPYTWDSWLDYVAKVQVNPSNGEIVLAIHGFGLKRLVEEAGGYVLVDFIGGSNDHYYCDFDFDAEGNVLLVLSEFGYNKYYADPVKDPVNKPGVYFAPKGTLDFVQIDADQASFPETHERSLIRFAPSDPNVGYVYTHKGNSEVAFHKIDIAENKLIDRTEFLPASPDNDNGVLGRQGNYNMTLAVKPDDADFIVIGSTSLFRTKDGFTSIPEFYYGWIGGYEASKSGSNSSYFNHHADCHITVFDPNNSTEVWSGHDGGLSYVENITASTVEGTNLQWVDKNNGYNVTQYYTVSDIVKANEDRYMGGTQDNGTPAFVWDGSDAGKSTDISSGDGAYCYLGSRYAYVSSQNGNIMRVGYGSSGMPLSPYSPTGPYNWTVAHPSEATGQIFINPFVVDNNDENVMYYAGGEQIWINKALKSIPGGQNETMDGWYAPAALTVEGATVTALAISQVPSNVLYYAAYSSNAKPQIYRVKNSHYEEDLLEVEDISTNAAAVGSYPYYIAINPANADEIIIVCSNYGIPSLFHSEDGGKTYTNIDGNLASTDTSPGPSFRGAAIQNWEGEKTFYISTSIGAYKTNTLNGASTNWEVIAKETLGNVVCNRVKTSDLDGKVVIATHGRGLFVGQSSNPLFIANKQANIERFLGAEGEVLNVGYVFDHSTDATIEVSIQSNSDEDVVTATLDGNQLTLDYSDTNIGVSTITLKGTAGTDFIESSFSVTVKDHEDTAVDDIIEQDTDEKLTVYPNPSDGEFVISAQNLADGKCEISIYDTNGRRVYTRVFNSTNELNNYPFNLRNEAAGMYVIKIQTEEKVYSEKLRIK